jgi:uncharacterized protein
MSGFVGRARELALLDDHLEQIRRGGRLDQGQTILVRGRRRVGKSALVTEFVRRAGVPSVYFSAAKGAPVVDELAHLTRAIAESDLPGAAVAQGNNPTSLTAALSLLAAALSPDTPAVVVLDEVPWLLEGLPGGAGELQRVWDRQLAGKPVLLLLLGSDLAMMERLTQHDQPYFARGTEIILEPLTPRDVAAMTRLNAFEAFDAYLISGGLPLIIQEWEPGTSPQDFLEFSLSRSSSALVVSGERILNAEFSADVRAREVLTAIGGRGERTFSNIHRAITGMTEPMLSKSLKELQAKRVIAADHPLSTVVAAKDKRWRIADPGLRFWLAFVEPSLGDIERGRPDLAVDRFTTGYEAWRGRAIEPVVRASLERLLPDAQWPKVRRVGGWWPRNNTPEVDLVGVDTSPASAVSFVGTIKWHKQGLVTKAEVDSLAADATSVPGVTVATPLVAVCPAGKVRDRRVAQSWTAKDLLNAW